MKNLIVVSVLILPLVLMITVIGCGNKSGTGAKEVNPPALQDTEVYTVDSAIHKIVQTTMKKGEIYPLTNLETGEKTLWKAYYCNNCKTVFGEKPGTKATKCPKCGSTDFTPDTVKDHLDAPVWDK